MPGLTGNPDAPRLLRRDLVSQLCSIVADALRVYECDGETACKQSKVQWGHFMSITSHGGKWTIVNEKARPGCISEFRYQREQFCVYVGIGGVGAEGRFCRGNGQA